MNADEEAHRLSHGLGHGVSPSPRWDSSDKYRRTAAEHGRVRLYGYDGRVGRAVRLGGELWPGVEALAEREIDGSAPRSRRRRRSTRAPRCDLYQRYRDNIASRQKRGAPRCVTTRRLSATQSTDENEVSRSAPGGELEARRRHSSRVTRRTRMLPQLPVDSRSRHRPARARNVRDGCLHHQRGDRSSISIRYATLELASNDSVPMMTGELRYRSADFASTAVDTSKLVWPGSDAPS